MKNLREKRVTQDSMKLEVRKTIGAIGEQRGFSEGVIKCFT